MGIFEEKRSTSNPWFIEKNNYCVGENKFLVSIASGLGTRPAAHSASSSPRWSVGRYIAIIVSSAR